MAEPSQILMDFFKALRLADIPLPARISFDGEGAYQRIAPGLAESNSLSVIDQSLGSDGIVFMFDGVKLVFRP